METFLEELRVFWSRIGGLRSILLHLALLAAFGIWLPHSKGVDFLDSQVLGAYACLGLIFAGPATAQCFTESVVPSFARAKARVFVGVLYAEVVVLALLGTGIATIYLSQRGSYIPTPDWPTLAKSVAFGFGACALVSAMAAWATVRFSRSIAVMCLRLMFFGLLLLFFYKGQRLPEVALEGASVSIALAALFVELLRRACRESSPSATI